MNALFPQRGSIGSDDWGLDADSQDHAADDPPRPELTVTDRCDVAGHLWAPDGKSYRTVLYREPIPFGFGP